MKIRKHKNAIKRLKARQETFERIPVDKRRGMKRPGSLNPKKH